jgi:hypothetical protein
LGTIQTNTENSRTVLNIFQCQRSKNLLNSIGIDVALHWQVLLLHFYIIYRCSKKEKVMEAKIKGHTYHTAVRWTGEKRGVSTANGKPPIDVATPPEFQGHEGIWSPEDLFVSSVNACVMMTFLAFAERGHRRCERRHD